MHAQQLAIGLDVGSTTVKAVVVDLADRRIVWSDYQRHETRQPETVESFLIRIGAAFPSAESIEIFVTGSGSGPMISALPARFVQEVNSVAMAVEKLHPDVSSVVELGGQDAKILIFREQRTEDGRTEKTVIPSMNDKCASGTGATIDKCLIKVGMPSEDLRRLTYDPARLHHVAAKCGVFAETDIVNLVKSGIPAGEIMNSLADAIVHQNLSVLTRGNTLKPKVLLLGGPNSYLPFLVACWRHRIPETWEQRGYAWPRDIPVEELVVVPENSQYYAAYGAVLFGLAERAEKGPLLYAGLDGLHEYLRSGRGGRLAAVSAAPLVRDADELQAFLERYPVPEFVPATFAPGQIVRGAIGLDGGSTSSKAVLVDEAGDILLKAYRLSKGNPIQDTKEILAELRDQVEAQGATLEVIGFGATGYAAPVLEESVRADVNVVETVAHLIATVKYVPDADVICDIGGQDIKVLFLGPTADGSREVKDFKLSNQCSAGNGMLLQAMADQFGVKLTDYSKVAFDAPLAPKFGYGCAVFLDADRVNFQKEGYTAPEMLAGLAQVLPKNVWQYVVNVPRLAQFGRVFVLQGGTQRNLAAVKAQVDYIEARVPNADVRVHPHCGEAGAIGAALETLRVVRQRGSTRFIGIDAAINLSFTSRNDESTRCNFCPNHCSRTFIDTETPDGRTSRYISGFSCEKGTVESKESLKVLARERSAIRGKYPNLLAEEAVLAFKHFYEPKPLPPAGASKQDVAVRVGLFYRVARRAFSRGFNRSHADLSQVRIGLPRVLNMYSVGPFFRTFLETLGVPKENVVWSSPSTEEMWQEGGRYGSVDPCFPSKVVQAHVHELLNHAHTDEKRGPLQYLWFPTLTRVPNFLRGVMDNVSCPVVAGTPNVIKAAFTKEIDFFQRAGVEYLDGPLSFTETLLMKKALFDLWGPRLGVTEDEVEWAADEGLAAIAAFDAQMQRRGREVLEQVERDNRVAILVLGRPYHGDPGLHHGIPEEFQVLGYPILSIRSLPRDEAWMRRFWGPPTKSPRPGADDPLDIRDVWPENFSANSAQRVWAAKYAARHQHIAILDLSSFKCGHDAPTYGVIDSVVSATKTPIAQLHDLDANKPGGSIAIRVKTYAYRLQRIEEDLRENAKKRAELARRVAEERARWTSPTPSHAQVTR
jgi:activator of 2-hydroxyglutaryl-CoA dehydratase/predicted nucleotide-binding protein (sugar kinase/HSP70/actin superfamily)